MKPLFLLDHLPNDSAPHWERKPVIYPSLIHHPLKLQKLEKSVCLSFFRLFSFSPFLHAFEKQKYLTQRVQSHQLRISHFCHFSNTCFNNPLEIKFWPQSKSLESRD